MRNESDIIFMKRALELANLAEGSTRPNPMVGAVVVHNGKIIGEGYHASAGEPHAEVNAIRSAPSELLPEATIYVTLEPCSHFGRTPPCAPMLVEKGIQRVVVGVKDSSSKVSGRGIEILRKGGCKVTVGVMEKECREMNRRFFTYHEKKRPYIILKWAESEDGFMDAERTTGSTPGPNWITGQEERILVHKWRSLEHAILIGENTMITDDPELNVRLWNGIDPVRVVLSDSTVLPGDLKMLTDDYPLLLFSVVPHNLKENKENILLNKKSTAIEEVLKELAKREVQSVMVEGGANILKQFIELGLWDEARVFKGYKKFTAGISAPTIEGFTYETVTFEKSTLIYIRP